MGYGLLINQVMTISPLFGVTERQSNCSFLALRASLEFPD